MSSTNRDIFQPNLNGMCTVLWLLFTATFVNGGIQSCRCDQEWIAQHARTIVTQRPRPRTQHLEHNKSQATILKMITSWLTQSKIYTHTGRRSYHLRRQSCRIAILAKPMSTQPVRRHGRPAATPPEGLRALNAGVVAAKTACGFIIIPPAKQLEHD